MKVNNICIFGAGSAGWITALSIKSHLPEVNVTLLSSNKVPTIGVGESTQLDLVELLHGAGINVNDFIHQTDATLKHGIYYKNWNTKDSEYWHAFTNLSETGYYTRAHLYHKLHNMQPETYPLKDYYSNVHPSYTQCVTHNRSSSDMPFALHTDAAKMVEYLRNFLAPHITINDFDDFSVNTSSNKIDSIVVDGNTVTADLYVDCSGFNRVLASYIDGFIEDNYDANVNSAIFGRVNYGSVIKNPYTLADAQDCGWIWKAPLQSKVGSGYVFNDNFCDVETAKEHFIKYWGGSVREETVRSVKFSSSSLKNPWVSNVVCNGLSAGFVEPLEATGISWFIQGAKSLCRILKNRYYNEDTQAKHNSLMRMYVEDVQDFVDVHYSLSNRRDTEFWRYQTSRPRSDRLMSRLELYSNQMPNKNNREGYNWAFNDVSWLDILTGYGFKMNTNNLPEDMKYTFYR